MKVLIAELNRQHTEKEILPNQRVTHCNSESRRRRFRGVEGRRERWKISAADTDNVLDRSQRKEIRRVHSRRKGSAEIVCTRPRLEENRRNFVTRISRRKVRL